MYKCPADIKISPRQKSAGWSQRVRSPSMNAFIGIFSDSPGRNAHRQEHIQSGFPPGPPPRDIPNPSEMYVMLDEHPDSINDGYFPISPTEPDGAIFPPPTTTAAVHLPSPMVTPKPTSGSDVRSPRDRATRHLQWMGRRGWI